MLCSKEYIQSRDLSQYHEFTPPLHLHILLSDPSQRFIALTTIKLIYLWRNRRLARQVPKLTNSYLDTERRTQKISPTSLMEQAPIAVNLNRK
jgi:hypothetical protein